MNAISYAAAEFTIREDFAAAHNRYWQRLAQPGAWFTGAQRVAIAAEVRQARECGLCRRRKEALSPTHVDGSHDSTGQLRDVIVDVVHRVVTDPARLTRSWFDGVMAQGLTQEEYVEIIGTLVAMISIDDFCRGIGVDLNPLPDPEPGEPTHYRPTTAVGDEAWVAMIPADKAIGAEADLWEGRRAGNVIRAMSLVPDEVRTLMDLGDVHYVPRELFMDFSGNPRGILSRVQLELIASRVSALNGCFY